MRYEEEGLREVIDFDNDKLRSADFRMPSRGPVSNKTRDVAGQVDVLPPRVRLIYSTGASCIINAFQFIDKCS